MSKKYLSELNECKKFGVTRLLFESDIIELIDIIKKKLDELNAVKKKVENFIDDGDLKAYLKEYITSKGRIFTHIKYYEDAIGGILFRFNFGDYGFQILKRDPDELVRSEHDFTLSIKPDGKSKKMIKKKYDDGFNFFDNCRKLFTSINIYKKVNNLFPKEFMKDLLEESKFHNFVIGENGEDMIICKDKETFQTIDFKYKSKDYKLIITKKLEELVNNLTFYLTTKTGIIFTSDIFFLKNYEDRDCKILKILEKNKIIY